MKAAIASDKVAIYIRWSTEDQGLGHTLEIQRESCRYYCLSQGWAPRDDLTFIDDGYSGSTLERPAMTRLRAAVAGGAVDCVVLYKLDRLSRNIKDIINLVLDEWEDTCTVRSTQEPVDTSSDAGRMFFTMLGSFADFERASIKTRTWSGKRKNAEKGRNPGIIYPYGFAKAEAGGWEIVPDEAAVIRRIFDEYLKGRSCRHIAFGLNDEGRRTRSDKLWANADISRLLRNPLYCGRLEYNRRAFAAKRKTGKVADKPAGEVITFDGAAPAIVDTETWAQAERVRASRPRVDRGSSARTQSSPYLLSGLLRCTCGHAWVGIQGGKANERFYACAGARSSGPAKCTSRSVKTAALDAFVLQRVQLTWPLKGPFRADLLAGLRHTADDHEARIRSLRQRLSAQDSALARFREDYKTGKLTAEIYMELISDTRAEREQLATHLQNALADHKTAGQAREQVEQAADWYARLDAWEALELTERQQVLRMLIERITVSRPKGGPDLTLHVDWRLPASSI